MNDQQGHSAANQLLVDAAQVINSSIRHTVNEDRRTPDEPRFAARYAGDEFCIVFIGMDDVSKLGVVAKRVGGRLAQIGIEASIGGGIHQPGESSTEFFDRVDSDMYAQKEFRKQKRIAELPFRQRIAHKLGTKLVRYAGVNSR